MAAKQSWKAGHSLAKSEVQQKLTHYVQKVIISSVFSPSRECIFIWDQHRIRTSIGVAHSYRKYMCEVGRHVWMTEFARQCFKRNKDCIYIFEVLTFLFYTYTLYLFLTITLLMVKTKLVHPSIFYHRLVYTQGRWGDWILSQRRRSTPWSGRQIIAGPTQNDNKIYLEEWINKSLSPVWILQS